METWKTKLEEMGVLKEANKTVPLYECGVDNCKRSYRARAHYVNHLKLKHDAAWTEYIGQNDPTPNTPNPPSPLNPPNPLKRTMPPTPQIVLETDAIDKPNYPNEYVTSWSMVRLGFADSFCEDIKKMMKMQQTFYNTNEQVRHINNVEPFTYVTQTPFRKTIACMASNIKQQLFDRIKQSPFYSLYIGETIDIESFSHLLVIVRYKHRKSITEDLLFSQALNLQQSTQIFVIIDTFVRTSGLDWNNCIGISMDGERATTGPLKNVTKCLANNFLSIPITYTFTRRGEFITSNIGRELKCVLNDIKKLVNDFKTCNGVKFSDEIESKYKNLLIHTEDFWLSYGKVLKTMFYMAEYRKVPVHRLGQLAYLVDIIDHFNVLNAKLQNHGATIFDVYNGISSMYDKLGTYKEDIHNDTFTEFPTMRYLFNRHGDFPTDVKFQIRHSLKQFRKNIFNYLPVPKDERANYEWIRKPFEINECPEMFTMRDEIAEWKQLKKDKPAFTSHNLESFWIVAYQKYPNISERAIKFLLNFKSSHFYEKGFAALVDIRTKNTTDLSSEDSYLRIKLSPIKPQLEVNINLAG